MPRLHLTEFACLPNVEMHITGHIAVTGKLFAGLGNTCMDNWQLYASHRVHVPLGWMCSKTAEQTTHNRLD